MLKEALKGADYITAPETKRVILLLIQVIDAMQESITEILDSEDC